MPGLVLEGGTFRPIFSAGVMDALLDEDIMFPYVIGVSAGITNGTSYISRQLGRNLRILMSHRKDSRYIGMKNLLKERSIFGLDFVFDLLPNKLDPFDWDTYKRYKGTIRIGATNAQTGRPEYFDGHRLDEKLMMLRASCALPLLFPAIRIHGVLYYDGGISDPIPIRKAIKDGSGKNLIVLTRPKEYRKRLSRSTMAAAKILGRKYPRLREQLLSRHKRYNETVRFCERQEREGKALILRPDHPIESMEGDIDVLKQTYDMGYKTAKENIRKIRELF